MLKSSAIFILLSTLALAQHGQNGGGRNANGAKDAADTQDTLSPLAIQSASDFNGDPTGEESPSLTDKLGFHNFCVGKTLTNGKQIQSGSCNSVVGGDIPAKDSMISALILNPEVGKVVEPNTPFDVAVQVQNLVAGVFTNPNNTYYSAPQQLKDGKVLGHVHVVIQQMQSFTDTTPPDAATFAFFKGIDDDGNGQGLLKATVTNGLPAGFYRVCTIMGTANHAPPMMPVAQRGAQEDCTKFKVAAGGGSDQTDGQASNQNVNGDVGKAKATGSATAPAASSDSGDGSQVDQGTGSGADATATAAAADASATGTHKDHHGHRGGTKGGDKADSEKQPGEVNRGDASGADDTGSKKHSMMDHKDHKHDQRMSRGRRYISTPDLSASGPVSAPVRRFHARAFRV